MKAAFYTLGCKVNQYETESMLEELQQAGFEIVGHQEEADIYIVNSCTVTSVSDQKTRQSVRRLKRSHPNAVVVLTGCMPQAYPQAAAALEQADIVISNHDNKDILSLIGAFFTEKKRIVKVIPHKKGEPFQQASISGFHERTRAFVKIEDGCDRYCSYCIIPTARGRVRSKPLEELKKELLKLSGHGIKEVVLVGINLSSYGRDMENGVNLCDAVETAGAVPGIERVRLGSLEPDHLTESIVRRLSLQKKLCPQFHISLQSGSDATLKKMNRHYTTAEYKALCEALRKEFPDCSLTTDLMVGFPYEGEKEFEESLEFMREIGFEKVHVFPYSPREGTRAAQWPQVEKSVKEDRSHRMMAAAEALRAAFLKQQVGKTAEVLLESAHDENRLEGYTKNYTPVRITSLQNLKGKTVAVEITGVEDGYCTGVLASEQA